MRDAASGMNLMADHMRQIGGRVGVATAPGKFTRRDHDVAARRRSRKTTRWLPSMDTSAANGSLKLMIVDDSNIIRRRIERSQQIDRLEVVGCRGQWPRGGGIVPPHSARRGDHGSDHAEMDGIECVEQLVAINPKVLILVVPALADKATAVEAIEKGANGFLCKPFTDRQLNDALEELLREA